MKVQKVPLKEEKVEIEDSYAQSLVEEVRKAATEDRDVMERVSHVFVACACCMPLHVFVACFFMCLLHASSCT